MVWGGISYEARTNFVVFDRRSVNVQRCVEEVLEDHVIPFVPFISDNFRLIHFSIPQDVSLNTLMRSGFKFYHGLHLVPILTQLKTFGTILKDVSEQAYQPLRP